jgi:hypothetical protein
MPEKRENKRVGFQGEQGVCGYCEVDPFPGTELATHGVSHVQGSEWGPKSAFLLPGPGARWSLSSQRPE